MSETKTERQAVAEIYARQDPIVQDIIKQVLDLERSRLHVPQEEVRKITVDQLADKIRRIVS